MNAPVRRLGWSLLAACSFALVGCDTTPTPPPPDPNAPTPTPTNPAKSAREADAKAAAEKAAAEAAGKPENEVKSMPVDPAKPDPKGAAVAPLKGEELAEIKKLPADEQPIAMAQVMCPVSDDHLGAGGMGMPVKKVVDGKTVFLCCKGCEKDFDADPAKYLAKAEKK